MKMRGDTLNHFKGLALVDTTLAISVSIDLLLGVEVFFVAAGLHAFMSLMKAPL